MRVFQGVLLTSVLLTTGCSTAQRSSEVNAVYVPAEQYKSMSCEDLSASAEAIRKKTPALAKAVDDARKTDKLMEALTVVVAALKRGAVASADGAGGIPLEA